MYAGLQSKHVIRLTTELMVVYAQKNLEQYCRTARMMIKEAKKSIQLAHMESTMEGFLLLSHDKVSDCMCVGVHKMSVQMLHKVTSWT